MAAYDVRKIDSSHDNKRICEFRGDKSLFNSLGLVNLYDDLCGSWSTLPKKTACNLEGSKPPSTHLLSTGLWETNSSYEIK